MKCDQLQTTTEHAQSCATSKSKGPSVMSMACWKHNQMAIQQISFSFILFFSFGLAFKVQWNNMNAIIFSQFYRCLVTKVKGDCLVFIKKKKQFLQKRHAQEKNVYLSLHSVDCCFVFSVIFMKLLSGKGLFSQQQQFFTWDWAKSLMLPSCILAGPWHPVWWEEEVMEK